MKPSLLLSALAILLFTGAFLITDQGVSRGIHSDFLRDKIYPTLARPMNALTDVKFRIRGKRLPRNPIVVVEVDSNSLDQYGRWPWHRNTIAALIDQVFAGGARVVGLDMVFSERDQRVPDALKAKMAEHGLGRDAEESETDPMLAQVIAAHRENLVLGWASDGICRPGLAAHVEDCPASNPQAIESLPPGYDKFGFRGFAAGPAFSRDQTPLETAITLIPNLPEYNSAALHAGTFNISQDDDGTVRRSTLFTLINGIPHPSLAAEMAQVIRQDQLKLTLSPKSDAQDLQWAKDLTPVQVSSLGQLAINFRGPSHSFPYISAFDLLNDQSPGHAQAMAALKDTYAIIGVSALGVYDMRSMPFDNNIAGVEGHANILDNLLSNDELRSASQGVSHWLILAVMVLGAAIFAYGMQVLDATVAIWVFLAILAIALVMDETLFSRAINLNSIYFYLELASVFGLIISAKYIDEQKNKKFLKSAFGKYVSPAIVDSILKNPDKLSLGGDRREMTILFSDIRGFTTLSEGMDAKNLSAFLNDYLGIMTGIVFKNEGTLDKYIGDAVMAFWGAPLDQPNHAELAAKTALEMLTSLAEHFPRFKSEHGVEVRIGVGVNSGVVSVGNMGSEQNFEYTVIGDHVNLASRLEGLTKMYGAGIVTSRFTFDCIEKAGHALPPHRVLDQVIVKGKKKSIELIQLLHQKIPDEALALFEQARVKYRAQAWDEAIALFEKASRAHEAGLGEVDKTSLIYIERCQELKSAPPAQPWDGSWEMHEK